MLIADQLPYGSFLDVEKVIVVVLPYRLCEQDLDSINIVLKPKLRFIKKQA